MSKGRRKGASGGLAQREQQALDMLYKHGPSTAKELQEHIGDDLNNATVRTILRILESKGYVGHKNEGNRFIYHPLKDKDQAAQSIFNKLVDTFFSGSPTDAVAKFIDRESKNLEVDDYDELILLIQKAKKEKTRK